MTMPIARIRSLTLENFKGFRGRHGPIDLDADIVLITAPNGHGKTSLLEALTLALTGWHDSKLDPVKHLISRIPNENKGGDTAENSQSSSPEKVACVSLQAVSVQEGQNAVKIEWRIDNDADNPRHSGLPESRLDDSDAPKRSAELKARLCTFFQDRLSQLFDQSADGGTLRDVLEPSPAWVDWTQTAIDRVQKELQAKQEDLEDQAREPSTDLHPEMDVHLRALAPPYERLRKELQTFSERDVAWPSRPEGYETEDAWLDFVLTVLKLSRNQAYARNDLNLPEALKNALVGDGGVIGQLIV